MRLRLAPTRRALNVNHYSVGPAGVEPALRRVSDGCLTAQSQARIEQRPVWDSNPSRLFDKQVATPAASQGHERKSQILNSKSQTNPKSKASKSETAGTQERRISSKAGRIRTHSAGFGDRLLSQEHDLGDSSFFILHSSFFIEAEGTGVEPASPRGSAG
jgi:hypothetical protein